MTHQDASQLRERFYQGTTTHDEELQLARLLRSADCPADWTDREALLLLLPEADEPLPADFHRRRLDRYRRADFDGFFLRHEKFFSPTLTVHHRWHMAQRQWNFSYALTSAASALLNLLDIENNADPLNVYHGNADQKSAHFHDFDFNYQNNSTRKSRFFSLYAHYRLMQDAQAWGYTYDRATGIRHYRPGNVNGNYLLTGGVNYTMPLDRPKRLTLSTQTYGQFGQGVDLMENVRSTAKITYITETLRLDYTIGKWKICSVVVPVCNASTSAALIRAT